MDDDPLLARRDYYSWVRCSGGNEKQSQGCQGAHYPFLISQLALKQPTFLRAI